MRMVIISNDAIHYKFKHNNLHFSSKIIELVKSNQNPTLKIYQKQIFYFLFHNILFCVYNYPFLLLHGVKLR